MYILYVRFLLTFIFVVQTVSRLYTYYNLLECTFVTQGLKDHFRRLKDEIERQHWIVSRDNAMEKVPLSLKNLTLRQAHSVLGAMGGRRGGLVTDDDRFLELRMAVMSRNRASSKTYEEWYDGWHSEHLKMLLASGMTEEEAHKEATVYADDQIAAMSRNKISKKGAQPPTDILNCKHCLKLYMSERILNEHLNIEGCHLNGDFSMDLLNTDGRIGIYLPEARKVRIFQFHAKRKKRL
jgi:hypothetical protein